MQVHTVVFTYCSHMVSGSVVHVDVDKVGLCMDMQGTMPLKKQFTDACSQSSVHTMFTDGDTW